MTVGLRAFTGDYRTVASLILSTGRDLVKGVGRRKSLLKDLGVLWW